MLCIDPVRFEQQQQEEELQEANCDVTVTFELRTS